MQEAEMKDRMSRVYSELRDSVGCAVIIPNKNVGPEAINTPRKGTVSFIETPSRRLLITCAHVWDEFLSEYKDNPDAHLLVIGANGRESFVITDATEIDRDSKQLDMVTLDIARGAERVEECGKRFFKQTEWPTPFVQRGDTVVGLGYSGQHQKSDLAESQRISKLVIQLRPTVVIVTVSSSSTRHFVLAENTDENQRHEVKFDTSLDDLKSLGGASGAAYYLVREKTLQFAGIQYEARGENAVDAAILVSHAAYLKPDGTIDRSLLPFV